MAIYDPGADAPLTSNIILSKQSVQPGEAIIANWEGTWWNRIYSWCGGANIAGFWFLDGVPIAMMSGPTKSVATNYCNATNPQVGCISELRWDWNTLPIVATLLPEGETVAIKKTMQVDTTGLSVGSHRLSARVFMINGPTSVDMFTCGSPMGVACPLQTESQGFPNSGVYGSTKHRFRPQSSRCPNISIPAISPTATFYEIPATIETCGSAGGWCCGFGSSGANYDCYNWGGKKYVTCGDWGPYYVWDAWTGLEQTVGKTYEETLQSAENSAVEVAAVDFEVGVVEETRTVTVRANVLSGYPAPSVDIEIYANVLVKSRHWDAVARGESVSESVELGAGTYDVFARARLSNPFGTVEGESPHQTVVV